MSASNIILLGIAGAAILAAVAAFTIAWRRAAEGADWRRGVSRETREADRPTTVQVAVPEAEVVHEEPEPTEEAPERSEEPVALAIATEQRLVEVSTEEAGVTRRQFFNRAMGATFGTFMGLLGLDFLAFLWPKISGGFGADVVAGTVQDLLNEAINDDGSITPVFVAEARSWVVPTFGSASPQFEGKEVEAGGLMALFQRCVHLGCRVPWCETSQGFECPCHGSKYNGLGEYFAGPAPRNLDRFVVEVDASDQLIIKTRQRIETPRALQKSVAYPQGPSCIGDVGGGE